jgi:hypothetical protein
MFKDLWENLLVSLVLEGVIPNVDKIKLIMQPANSPDMNVNNNGLFNALQARYKRYTPKNAKEMIYAAIQVWKDYPHKKINHMFLTMQTNFDKVIKCHGDSEVEGNGNIFKYYMWQIEKINVKMTFTHDLGDIC